jgi:myo-inositol-1(or 4)-monophosphatase
MLQHAGMLSRYQELAACCRLQRWGGDCYGFALLAQGCIDLMVDSMLMPYDIVPLIPIIAGAGGVVTDLHGNSPLHGGTVVAAANAQLHAAALEIMTRPSANG